MAMIKVEGTYATVTLGDQDEDGDYQWECLQCGERGDCYRPLDEAIADAEIHADMRGEGVE